MSTIGSRIKLLRDKNNLSQKQFAKNLGISNVVLSRYETSERNPDYDTLIKIADYFNVSLDFLFNRFTNTVDRSFNDAKAFEIFTSDTDLQQWYKELSESNEDEIFRIRKIWNIIKEHNLY